MTLTLYVDTTGWRAHVERVAAANPGLVPVVKGNGYGFGRARLADEAARLGVDELAVGTVSELEGLPWPPDRTLVLTPFVDSPDVTRANRRRFARVTDSSVLTVGGVRHVRELEAVGWRGAVIVKLASSMRRFGATADELPAVLAAVDGAGLIVHGFGLHLPLVGDVQEIEQWLSRLPTDVRLYVSHVSADDLATLRVRHPDVGLRPRLGTALWHAAGKDHLTLQADVLDVHPVRAGEGAGYRGVAIEADGLLTMVGAGTAHGVHPLEDGRSPFHWHRRRLPLIEPPHMHTSMVLVSADDIAIGDAVDVQQPLTRVAVDEVVDR